MFMIMIMEVKGDEEQKEKEKKKKKKKRDAKMWNSHVSPSIVKKNQMSLRNDNVDDKKSASYPQTVSV